MLLANGLIAAGRQRTHLYVTATFIFVNVILSVVLIGWYGALGGAIAVVTAFALELVLFVYTLRTSLALRRVGESMTRILAIWFALMVPLYGLTWYFRHAGGLSVSLAIAVTIVFSAAFLYLLGKFNIVTPSLIRRNLIEN